MRFDAAQIGSYENIDNDPAIIIGHSDLCKALSIKSQRKSTETRMCSYLSLVLNQPQLFFQPVEENTFQFCRI